MKILILLLFTLNITFAQQIAPIKTGERALHDGFLVDKKFAELATANDKKVDILEKKVELQDLRINVTEEQAKFYKDKAKKEEARSTWKGIGGFVLGVLATSLASYAAIKATK